MVVPPAHAGLPGIGSQLMVLPPMAKVLAGATMAAMGLAAMVMLPGSLFSILLLAMGVGVGIPLLLAGCRDRVLARVEAAEMSRAKAERDVLVSAVADAVRAKRGVHRVLRERGYTSEKVRRWIALEGDVVLPPGGD